MGFIHKFFQHHFRVIFVRDKVGLLGMELIAISIRIRILCPYFNTKLNIVITILFAICMQISLAKIAKRNIYLFMNGEKY